MKTKVVLVTILLAFVAFCSMAQQAEKRFGIEVNGDVSFATSELSGAKLNTGLGFETILQYRFLPFTSVYGGWGWNNFNADESFAGPDMDFEETGYVLGLQFKNSFKNSPLSYFLRAGALYNHIETENNDGEIVSDSGHGFGWQLAGGFEVDLGKNWSLAPGIKYNSLSGETKVEGNTYELDHRYVALRLGVVKRF